MAIVKRLKRDIFDLPTAVWRILTITEGNSPQEKRLRAVAGSGSSRRCISSTLVRAPAQAYACQFLATLEGIPPRQKAASFAIGQVTGKLQMSGGSKNRDA
jgi:hypothetical protein